VVMEGIKTNAPLHRRIMDHPDFLAGKLDTHFMERFLPPRKTAAAAS
jgi:acetyl-CoA carboxylase, biotin carboxylase subunit